MVIYNQNLKLWYINSLVYIVCAFNTFCLAQIEFDTSKLKSFETYLMELVHNSKAAGVEVLIHHKGETVWHKALGFSSLQDNRLLEKNSIYYIQSMTKPIKSVANMQLVEQGKLNLADAAANYYPPLKKLRVIKDMATGIHGPTVSAKQPITILHILPHTSGLSHGLEETLFDQQLFKLMYNELFDPAEYDNLSERVNKLMLVPLIVSLVSNGIIVLHPIFWP